jgi:hypothetical protein
MGEYVSFVKITPVLPPGHVVQVSQYSKIIQYLTHIPCAPFALMMMNMHIKLDSGWVTVLQA